MKTAGIKRTLRSGPEPHGEIDSGWRSRVRLNSHRLHPSLVTPDFHGADVAELAGINKFDCVMEMLLASLPLATLNDTLIPVPRRYHGAAFPDGVPDRFFHVNIFASCAGLRHNERMPVVGRTDKDHIDILPVDDMPVVTVCLNPAGVDSFFLQVFHPPVKD